MKIIYMCYWQYFDLLTAFSGWIYFGPVYFGQNKTVDIFCYYSMVHVH